MDVKRIERVFEITAIATAFGFSWREDFNFRGESHEMWEIVFLTDGCVEVTEDEKVYALEENNLIIHAPREFHRIKSANKTTPSGFILSFFSRGELPPSLRDGVFELSTEQRRRYLSICEGCERYLLSEDTNDYSGHGAVAGLESFLIELSAENSTTSQDTSPTAKEYRKIVLEMSRCVCENKTLAYFARECGDSVSYIKQIFKKHAGISPKTCYNQMRVRYASELLSEGRSVREVAELMCFPSANYFSSFFKKYTGKTPSGFRSSP